MRREIIAGNWKMNNLTSEVETFFKDFGALSADTKRQVIVAPAYPYLKTAGELARERGIELAAQDLYPQPEGAFTGMIGSKMLKDLGVSAVIIGHSERRHILHEPLDLIREKVRFAQEEGFHLIFCVGETLEERQSGEMLNVLTTQITSAFDNNLTAAPEMVTIAYEPVWAIGPGVVATPEQAEEMHSFIRKLITEKYGYGDSRILYVGSVKPNNINGLISLEDIDGALVGGASLKAESFRALVNA